MHRMSIIVWGITVTMKGACQHEIQGKHVTGRLRMHDAAWQCGDDDSSGIKSALIGFLAHFGHRNKL